MEKNKEFYKVLPSLVIPIIIQNLLTSLVNTADIIMLGFVSQSAISAVSLANQVTFVLNLFYMGILTGLITMSAQYWGKGDKTTICSVYGMAMRCSIIVGLIFSAASLIFPQYLMLIFTSDSELIDLGSSYLRIIAVSYLLMGISQTYLSVMKSIGRVKIATAITSGCLALNIVLNSVFIFGFFGLPKLGIVGVAIATTISRVAELVFALIHEHVQKFVPCRISNVFLRGNHENLHILWKDYNKYMLPALGSYLVWGVGFTMYSVIMGHLGNDAVAANSIALVVRNLAAIFGTGIGSGGTLYLGQLIGDNRLEQAKADGSRLCKLTIIFGVIGGGAILLLRPLILNMSELTPIAKDYLSFMLIVASYNCLGKVVNASVIGGIFCAGGDTKFGFILDTIVMWGVAVPLGLVLAFVFNAPVKWVYFVICLDEMIKLPFVFFRFRKYIWLKNITRDFETKEETA